MKDLKKNNDVVNSLSHNVLTSVGASYLFIYLKQNKYIRKLNLSNNMICDDSMKELGLLLENNSLFEEILLENNKLSDKGISILIPYLYGNTTLKILGLAGNQAITEISIPLFAKVLSSTSIETIFLHHTSIISLKPLLFGLITNKLKNKCSTLDFSQT